MLPFFRKTGVLLETETKMHKILHCPSYPRLEPYSTLWTSQCPTLYRRSHTWTLTKVTNQTSEIFGPIQSRPVEETFRERPIIPQLSFHILPVT